MRILQVVPYFYPAWSYGGPAKLVYDTSKELSKRGHTVTVYTSDAYNATERMPEEKKITDFRIHYFRNLSNMLAFKANAYLPVALFFRVPFELYQFDVIHLHDFYIAANVWVTMWARIYKIPYILSVHGCLEDERRQQKSLFKNVFLRLFGISMLRHAKRLIATSENEEKAFGSFGIHKSDIVRIGHGVNKSEFETDETVTQCRNKLKIPQNSFVFTFVGRLHYIKGLDLLLEAFSAMKEKNTFLVIAGSDEGFLSTIKKIIKNKKLSKRVLLLGPTTGEAKARLFKASNVFVYPSRSEGFSLGILEAASVGLPLLITKDCHFDEVKKAKTGVVVDTNSKALIDGLKEIYSLTEDERQEMGHRAANLIVKKYSMHAIGNQLEKLYLSLIATMF